MNINEILDGMNGTGLAELHKALHQARNKADSSNFDALTAIIEEVVLAGIRNCGRGEFDRHLTQVYAS